MVANAHGGETLSRQVARGIIEMIARDRYATGALLPAERELCSIFGASRTVIREALQVLAARGIVTIRRGTGVMVGSPTDEPMRDYLELLLRREGATLAELLELRNILEVEIAGLAAARSSPADHRAMAHSLRLLETHAGTPEGYVEADMEFHALIARAAGNRLVSTVMNPIADLLRASRLASFRGAVSVLEHTVSEHALILDCIIARDSAAARQAMRTHLARTQQDFLARGIKIEDYPQAGADVTD